jgi:hypothetical protein
VEKLAVFAEDDADELVDDELDDDELPHAATTSVAPTAPAASSRRLGCAARKTRTYSFRAGTKRSSLWFGTAPESTPRRQNLSTTVQRPIVAPPQRIDSRAGSC